MATKDYTGIYNTATRLLTKYGTTIILKKNDDSSWERVYNPVEKTYTWKNSKTGETRTSAPEDFKYYGVGIITAYTLEEKTNDSIETSDKRVYAQLPVKPKGNDIIIIGDEEYKYVTSDEINPSAGTPILYDIQIRK